MKKYLFITFLLLYIFTNTYLIYTNTQLKFWMAGPKINFTTETSNKSDKIYIHVYDGEQPIDEIDFGIYFDYFTAGNKYNCGINIMSDNDIRNTFVKLLEEIDMLILLGKENTYNSKDHIILFNNFSWSIYDENGINKIWYLCKNISLELNYRKINDKIDFTIELSKAIDENDKTQSIKINKIIIDHMSFANFINAFRKETIEEEIKWAYARINLKKLESKYQNIININKWTFKTANSSELLAYNFRVFMLVDSYVIFMHKDDGSLIAIRKNELGSVSENQRLAGMAEYMVKDGTIQYKNIKGFDIEVLLYKIIDSEIFK